jgi:hypothetical protein
MFRFLSVLVLFLVLSSVQVSARRRVKYMDSESLLAAERYFTEDEGEGGGRVLLDSNGDLPKADDHLVRDLPGLDNNKEKLTHYAGLLPGDAKTGGKIFYWLFNAAQNADTAPLVIWLNGGPGCSSMDGLWLELGPFRLEGPKMANIKVNPSSWHNAANIMFVDQPVGTGYVFCYTIVVVLPTLLFLFVMLSHTLSLDLLLPACLYSLTLHDSSLTINHQSQLLLLIITILVQVFLHQEQERLRAQRRHGERTLL